MKSQKSHHRQVLYHTYSTNIQTSNQVITDQISITKAQATPKLRKTIQKWKKFHKNYAQKAYMTLAHT